MMFKSKTEAKTQEIGREFSKQLHSGDIVCLYGDLGLGKTTFVKGVATGLGIFSRIISPTFTIIRKHGEVYHIDLYRIEGISQLDVIGIQEILEDNTHIKLIEWPEKLQSLPRKRWDIKFEMDKKNTRTININKHE